MYPSIAMIPPSGVTGPNILEICLLKTTAMMLLEKMNPPRAMAGPAKR